VLHGADNDLLWCQRDFHLYLVNVFDTEKACQVLGLEERSLGRLLARHCGVAAAKQHQRADWRARSARASLCSRHAHVHAGHRLHTTGLSQ
jgi:ribonuclease D